MPRDTGTKQEAEFQLRPDWKVYRGIAFVRVIVPLTRNTTMRGPEASIAARRLPGPESSRLVTSITRPPRPPTASAPNPSAVGNAFTAGAAAVAIGRCEKQRLAART